MSHIIFETRRRLQNVKENNNRILSESTSISFKNQGDDTVNLIDEQTGGIHILTKNSSVDYNNDPDSTEKTVWKIDFLGSVNTKDVLITRTYQTPIKHS